MAQWSHVESAGCRVHRTLETIHELVAGSLHRTHRHLQNELMHNRLVLVNWCFPFINHTICGNNIGRLFPLFGSFLNFDRLASHHQFHLYSPIEGRFISLVFAQKTNTRVTNEESFNILKFNTTQKLIRITYSKQTIA